MTGAVDFWSETWGGVMQAALGDPGDGDMAARVREQLDDRDERHLAQFGHLPGQDALCTLPPRSVAMTAALAGARAASRGAVLSGSSYDVAATLRRVAPMSPITVIAESPASAAYGALINGKPVGDAKLADGLARAGARRAV